jgi:hypothetical protein
MRKSRETGQPWQAPRPRHHGLSTHVHDLGRIDGQA